MAEHAKLSASGSHRWLECPGSIKLEASLPKEESKETYTLEGTCAHELAEICLKDWSSPHDYIGKELPETKGIEVDIEMANYVNAYLDYCSSTLEYFEVEKRVDLSKWIPEGFGTVDCIGISDNTLHVIDFKYGKGVKVDATMNSQLLIYALGAYDLINTVGININDLASVSNVKITNIVLHVYQPRINNINTYELSIKELLKFGRHVKKRAKLCLQKDPERVVGETQCRFCRAKAICPTLAKHTEDTIGACFEDISKDTLDVKKVDIVKVLDNKKLIESFLSAVEQYAFNEVEQGRKVGDYKIVEGRSIRTWTSEDDVCKIFKKLKLSKDDLYSKKIISPAQVKKIVDKDGYKLFEKIIIKPEGKPTLVPGSDKREALEPIVNHFENIN